LQEIRKPVLECMQTNKCEEEETFLNPLSTKTSIKAMRTPGIHSTLQKSKKVMVT